MAMYICTATKFLGAVVFCPFLTHGAHGSIRTDARKVRVKRENTWMEVDLWVQKTSEHIFSEAAANSSPVKSRCFFSRFQQPKRGSKQYPATKMGAFHSK